MGRGRARLTMIPAADVCAAMFSHRHFDVHVARDFRVTDRTVRRWMQTGLALWYGKVNVTRDEWESYVQSGASGRLEGQVPSRPPVRRRRRTGQRSSRVQDPKTRGGAKHAGEPPFPPRTKGKRMRLSRDLLRARGGKRGR